MGKKCADLFTFTQLALYEYITMRGGEIMLIESVKTNSVTVSYEMLSELGKNMSRRQTFNIMSLNANSQDFFDVGSAISTLLAYPVKEISKNNSTILIQD